jgi:predicted aspartyl protease
LGKPTSKSGKEKSIKKDLHSTKSSSTTSKKTPMVRINEKQNENHYADLDY